MNQFRMVTLISNSRLSEERAVISARLAGNTALDEGQNLDFSVGQIHRTLKVQVNDNQNKDIIYLHPSNLRRFYLHTGTKYGVMIDETAIKLGPVVGIMAETYQQEGKPFGGQSYFFKQMITNARKLGQICYGFSAHAVQGGKSVVGYTYGSRGWIRGTFPLPDVMYPREKGYSSYNRRIRHQLENMGVKMINPSLIGKWQTHTILSQHPELSNHVPDTRLVTGFHQVDTMLRKYRGVYIKPITGSMGRNIIKVVRQNNQYVYQYRFDDQVHRGTAGSLKTLYERLRRVMGNRRYIIQNQINLIRSGGNILDVRVLVQKDHTGEWGITGMACRVGRTGAITSNICSGGCGRKVDRTLRSHFHDEDQVQTMISAIRHIAVESACALEKAIGGSGEMGIDIGVDRDARIWFIEANLRPGRQVFTLIGERRTRMQTVVKPLLYSRYLAGF